MPQVQAPLLSLDARGTFAQQIVYSTWLGRNYVKRRPTRSLSDTPEQHAYRVMFGFLTDAWPYVDPGDKETWLPIAERFKITPANAFVGYNLRLWHGFIKPTSYYPRNPRTPPVALSTWTPIAGKGYIDYYAIAATTTYVWAIVFARHVPPASWPIRKHTVALKRINNDGAAAYHESHVPPGTYHCYSKTYNFDGTAGPGGTGITLTVT